jgi:hypothetical protein
MSFGPTCRSLAHGLGTRVGPTRCTPQGSNQHREGISEWGQLSSAQSLPITGWGHRSLSSGATSRQRNQGALPGVVEVLNAVYEVDFLGFSYGFRPGRSPQRAGCAGGRDVPEEGELGA